MSPPFHPNRQEGISILNFDLLASYHSEFLAGLATTVEVSLLALLLSFVLGTVIAVFRLAPFKWISMIGTVYVEFIRNTPLLVQVFFFYYGLASAGVKLDAFQSGTIGLTLYTAAFIAEAIRAGIQSVPKGHTEAGRASGLSYMQTMWHIVLPQAIKLVIPALGNQFLNLVKNSSILGVIAGGDLMYHADIVSSDTNVVFDVYIFVALFYLLLTIPLSALVSFLERRTVAAR